MKLITKIRKAKDAAAKTKNTCMPPLRWDWTPSKLSNLRQFDGG